MGVIGVVSALTAIISSTGLLLLLGVTFVDMCTVMPFLSLTIGIDDSFLMLAAWHETPRHLAVTDRIRMSMQHAAVSISITTLTDALAFLIGAIAPLPANAIDRRMWYQKFFEDFYAPFITTKWMILFSLLLFSSYVAAAVIGSQRVVVGFDLINIVLAESRPRRFLEIRKKFFPEDVSRMDIAVMKPPRMEVASERRYFLELLEKFEVLLNSESASVESGRSSTDFWYFSFKTYVQNLGFGDAWKNIEENEESFTENLRGFLMANDKFSYDILKYPNGSTKAFRLTTRLRNVSTDELIYQCAGTIRHLCDENPQYGLSTYPPLWNLADQYEIMWPQTIQDLYISVAVMLCVAMLFIPQPLCAPLIGLSIASVALGVLGIMPFIGVNLDATSMITIAMSVGFSVGEC
ncbi:patched family protein [Oesophagostomum dentatum]|uniref:Patched family protein n=1 Tax=Oesophagostomum dentatum TaxID=61180 RepID=A0A0B1T7F7_OESDE|nr:patched family protein [Oesophagostomum dentatum]